MNIYAEIAGQYMRVAASHDALAEQAAAEGEGFKAEHHSNRAAAARQWSHHYSCMALDLNNRDVVAHDERQVERMRSTGGH